MNGLREDSCAEAVCSAVREVEGVTSACADLPGRLVTVEAPRSVSVRALMEAVRRLV